MNKARFPIPPLRDVIYQRGESLLSVSSSCGVPYAVLVEVAEGRRQPSEDVATAVAAHFALEVVDLFGEVDMCHPGSCKDEPAPEPTEHLLVPPDELRWISRTNLGRGWRSVVRIDAGPQPAAKALKAFGVSRQEFATEYGLTPAEVVESLRGNRVPHRDTIAILIAATQLPVEKLFTEDVLRHL